GVPCSLVSIFGIPRVFFFSSRRRHTRWPRDWSSDVCSPIFRLFLEGASGITDNLGTLQKEADYYPFGGESIVSGSDINNYKFTRSEERRVGKEWSNRWSEEHGIKDRIITCGEKKDNIKRALV